VVGVLEKWRLLVDGDDYYYYRRSGKKTVFDCAPCAYSDRDLDFRLQLTGVEKTQWPSWLKEEGYSHYRMASDLMTEATRNFRVSLHAARCNHPPFFVFATLHQLH
jgi:hypothetical protein